jgi:hypothetical protein
MEKSAPEEVSLVANSDAQSAEPQGFQPIEQHMNNAPEAQATEASKAEEQVASMPQTASHQTDSQAAAPAQPTSSAIGLEFQESLDGSSSHQEVADAYAAASKVAEASPPTNLTPPPSSDSSQASSDISASSTSPEAQPDPTNVMGNANPAMGSPNADGAGDSSAMPH